MPRVVALAALLLSACSQTAKAPPVYFCMADDDSRCPTDEQVMRALELQAIVFSKAGVSIDPAPDMQIDWYPAGNRWGSYVDPVDGHEIHVNAVTYDGNHCEVKNWGGLAHERMHVHFFTETGSGDGDLDDGSDHARWPGPWTRQTDDLIEATEARILEEFGGEFDE